MATTTTPTTPTTPGTQPKTAGPALTANAVAKVKEIMGF
jgi:hypothetical protein